ncbi:SEC14-like protein 2 [Euwallacea similis]|uniref:SEC14-like protein 2 n=1 Tax=Euwallacea similis TaxID=1736056 RepID=UPI00344CEF5E
MMELDDGQKFALMKFRRSVHDVLQPHHNDAFLLRWLRARSWNPEAAEKMLRQSMRWRLQWEVDTALKNWTCPEVIKLYYPHGICGVDKAGGPIVVIAFSGLDLIGLLHSVSRQDLIRTTIQILENLLQIAAANGSSAITVLCDMEGFSLRQYTWRPAAEYIIALIQLYEANYPEILRACYIINAPRVFAIAFNAVKRFMNEFTISKIQIMKKDPKKSKAMLLANISADQLPVEYGGDLTDPDGNPKCLTKINYGGKVPKTYYTKNLQVDESANKKDYVKTVIKKGDKLVLDFVVKEEDCFLRWDFKTEDHDIRFGITLKDAEGKISPAVRHSRVASHQIDESGVLACQAPATYIVTFDNSYSLMRSKKISYSVYLTPSIKKMNILPSVEEVAAILENTDTIDDNDHDIEAISNLAHLKP